MQEQPNSANNRMNTFLNSGYWGALTVCIALCLGQSQALAFQGRAASRGGGIVVTYDVVDGYKVSLTIDTEKKKKAYVAQDETDVNDIEVDFIDVNGDGLQDVIVKYADETGYSPLILINTENSSFIDALSDLEDSIYVNTELDIRDDGKAVRRRDYLLKDITGDGIQEIVFYKTIIAEKGYLYVRLCLDKKTKKYSICKKGKPFEYRTGNEQ